jgi:FtsP/CotA-like multicopper oxidase with cupredoxin domain
LAGIKQLLYLTADAILGQKSEFEDNLKMVDVGVWLRDRISRRSILTGSLAAVGGTAIAARGALGQSAPHTGHDTAAAGHDTAAVAATDAAPQHMNAHGAMVTVGEVDNAANGFDPIPMLTDWERGTVSALPNGRTLRTFEMTAVDKTIEIAPGVTFPAWTYNGRVPGPALRAKEGERIRVVFRNNGSHPHSMHFHGIHAARMDGIPGAGLVDPGAEFVYEFDARPFGCHLYHCHALPLKRHIHKGMYGAFVIDPDPDRHPDHAEIARSRLLDTPENAGWQELVMVMNGFDTNFDEENEFYAANTIAHAYAKTPIRIVRGKPVRIYLVNVLEFDLINSFHLHGNFFDYFDQGTTLTPTLKTVDLIIQCQAQRGILEFTFAEHEPGLYMFHAHQSEFTELGWMGMFDVVEALA